MSKYRLISRDEYDGVLLYSGGLDSYVTYYYLTRAKRLNVVPVYFCLANAYQWFEEEHILSMKEFKVLVNPCIDLGDLEDPEDFHIPMRNVILMILAAIRYHQNVFIGSVYDDNSPDGNEKVFKAVTKLLNQVEVKAGYADSFSISAPLQSDGLRKSQACRWFVQNIASPEVLTRNSASCFKPVAEGEVELPSVPIRDGDYKSHHCYSCACCFRRNASLFSVGVKLPFYNQDLAEDYRKKFKEGRYDIVRTQTSIKYINWLESTGQLSV